MAIDHTISGTGSAFILFGCIYKIVFLMMNIRCSKHKEDKKG